MKKINKFKIDANHFMLVFENGSNSNYNRFVATYHNDNKKQALTGTSLKTDTTKEQYINYGLSSLKMYYNQSQTVL